ncbi:spermatogenesis associated 6-like protein isoform X5 [Anabas testudineus]|uniref:spermatogenesis associated 6-like protein isoform X5 n=1 Tax=Anabas testudineus TaxID=64144 RepID=UPI000E45AC7C|nr:spermatogenesis associated 6-like protein isoform X5 [Anabas testudineus]XP_026208947.1 spermatogenesis associated 6-like protein isoform X5 [Anabas testudineus]
MSRKALKVAVEVQFRAVSCPGVHLPAKDDIYLSICFMGQYRQSEDLPAVFPLLFHEKMTFEKIFRHAVDPGDITVMLEYETVRVELVQLTPPVGHTLALFEEDARRFLFPEPKLVPSFSGVDREVLMTRAPHFPGIAPRLEFSTKTAITECSADAEINIYPSVPMRPVIKRNRKGSGRPRTSSPQRKQHHTLERRRGARMQRGRQSSTTSLSRSPRSQSLSPLRVGNTRPLTRLSLDFTSPEPANTSSTSTSQPMLASWPGASRCASPHHSALFTSSPLTRSSSTDSLQLAEENPTLMVWVKEYLKMSPTLHKQMTPLATIIVLTRLHCGSLIENNPITVCIQFSQRMGRSP